MIVPYKLSQFSLIFDQKCKSTNLNSLSCKQLNLQYDKSQINKNFCAQANDEYYFNYDLGCNQPDQIFLNCDILGLSAKSCLSVANRNTCIFFNGACQYLTENIQLTDFKVLNFFLCFLCNDYKFAQCIWNENQCQYDDKWRIQQNYLVLEIRVNNQKYSKIMHVSKFLTLIYLNLKRLRRNQQLCKFLFKNLVQWEDSLPNCSGTNTLNLYCVLKNQSCINVQNVEQYDCNSFEQTNHHYCYQFKNCIYQNNQYQPLAKIYYFWFTCYNASYVDCILNNQTKSCCYDLTQNICQKDLQDQNCPIFQGYYYSILSCQKNFCNYGYTKIGNGFCYSGDILAITCEQLPYLFCLEDLSHLNPSLNCYYDRLCKTINNQTGNYQFLSQYYPAFQLFSENCIYSQIDHACRRSYF